MNFFQAYANSVPHPSGGVHGEELFQSGIIPSDTDFRVFRDFGPTPGKYNLKQSAKYRVHQFLGFLKRRNFIHDSFKGLDLAHCDNGYIYHTKLDRMEYIAPGVYQHTGDNILALVKELISSPELIKMDNPAVKQPSKVIYFDVFGAFMVVYSETIAICLNTFTVIFSTYIIYKTFSYVSGKHFSYFNYF